MAKKKRYYLAYGSNLNMKQMAHRCPGAKPVGTAMLPDYRLMYKGSKTGSYLTIEKEAGGSVPVGVWEVSDINEMALDRYEGFPTFYYKKDVRLKMKPLAGGRKRDVDAFVYMMKEDRRIGIPSGWYVDVCEEGYRDFGLDEEFLCEAFDYTIYRYLNEKSEKPRFKNGKWNKMCKNAG